MRESGRKCQNAADLTGLARHAPAGSGLDILQITIYIIYVVFLFAVKMKFEQ